MLTLNQTTMGDKGENFEDFAGGQRPGSQNQNIKGK